MKGGKGKAKGKGKKKGGKKGKKKEAVPGPPPRVRIDPGLPPKLYPRPRSPPKLASQLYKELTSGGNKARGGPYVPASEREHPEHNPEVVYPLSANAASRLCGTALRRQGAPMPAGIAPPVPPTRIRRQRCRAMLERYDALVAHLAERGADSAEVFVRRATLRGVLGLHVEAEDDARHALQLRAVLPAGSYQLGTALAQQGRFEEAVAAFRTGLCHDAHSAPLHAALRKALTYVRGGRVGRAHGGSSARSSSDEVIVDV